MGRCVQATARTVACCAAAPPIPFSETPQHDPLSQPWHQRPPVWRVLAAHHGAHRVGHQHLEPTPACARSGPERGQREGAATRTDRQHRAEGEPGAVRPAPGLLMKTPKDTELAVQGIQAKRTQISKNDADYLKELRSQDSRDAFQRDWLQLQTVTWPVAEANLQLLKDGKTEEAQTMLINQTIPAYARMQDWLVTARSAQGKSLSQEVDAIGADADSIRIFLVTLVAAISVGLLAFSWYIARLLRGRVTASREVAERVRQGDFTVPVDASVRDEFSPLLQSLSAMQDSLTTVVGTVRENAESVATASAQIAQGNQDLSQRTEEQASSLEETAASMEQLGSTVRQTSDNANQANQLAKGATAVAIKGGHVVGL